MILFKRSRIFTLMLNSQVKLVSYRQPSQSSLLSTLMIRMAMKIESLYFCCLWWWGYTSWFLLKLAVGSALLDDRVNSIIHSLVCVQDHMNETQSLRLTKLVNCNRARKMMMMTTHLINALCDAEMGRFFKSVFAALCRE